MEEFLIKPPVAFLIALLGSGWIYFSLRVLVFQKKGYVAGLTKAYACGEDVGDHMIRPDYGQFFPFAFFFTILHVVALMVTTLPTETTATFLLAVLYIAGAIAALRILYAKE